MSEATIVSAPILAEVTASLASFAVVIDPSGTEASATPAATFAQELPLER
jgi:hypothetical protein